MMQYANQCIYTYVYVYMYVCLYIYIYIRIYEYMYMMKSMLAVESGLQLVSVVPEVLVSVTFSDEVRSLSIHPGPVAAVELP